MGDTPDLHNLEANFTEAEIKEVIWSLAEDSAPGPNGFLILFFNTLRDIIKEDFIKLMKEIREIARLDRLNYSNVVLIPKQKRGCHNDR